VDVNTAAYRVAQISTGEITPKSAQKSRAGKLGALARKKALSKAKRRKIALNANRARWNGTAEKHEKGKNGRSGHS